MVATMEAGPRLFQIYQAITLAECIVGVILSAIVFRQWLRCYHKVTPVIQAYILVFFPDSITCVLYLARSSYSLKTGQLYTGPGDIWFCKFSAFITIAGCVALAFGVVCISFTILSMLEGHPVPDKLIIAVAVAGWVLGLALASIFAGADLLGSYKGLYCLCEVPKYKLYGTVPVLLTVSMCLAVTTRNYLKAYRIVKSVESGNAEYAGARVRKRASDVVFYNAASVIGTYLVSWILIFVNAGITAGGGSVPLMLDVVASLVAKFQPVSDCIHLHKMLSRIMSREGVHGANAKVNPTVAPVASKDNAAYSRIVLREEAGKPAEVTPLPSARLPDTPLEANEGGARAPVITGKTVLVSGLRATSDGAIVGGVRGLVNPKDEVVTDRYHMSRNEATVVLVDCSESMMQPFRSLKGHNMTRFEAAREIAWHYLARKALEQRKTVEVGVVAFGTDDTENQLAESMEEYNNIVEVAQLETVSIDNIRRVKELQPSSVPGELLAGLVVATQMLNKRIGKRKVEGSLIVLTDAASPVTVLLDEMEGLCEQIRGMNLALTVVGFDFADDEGEDLDVKMEAGTQEEVYKQENERMLKSIVDSMGDRGDILPAAEMYKDMTVLRREPAKSAATRVPFEISSAVTIHAQYMALTMAAKRPTLKKLDPEDSTKTLAIERVQRDSKGDEVSAMSCQKAYRYGGEVVPVGEEDIEMMKLTENKSSLKLLCTQPEAWVPRAYCMSNCLAVVGQRDEPASKVAISAFAHALHAQKLVAMVRFVRRSNSSPELGVLTPHVEGGKAGHYLVYNKLPFNEDDRDFAFPSFAQPARRAFRPSDDQKQAALDLVDAMMIQPKQPGGRALQFVPSPELAATNKLLIDRALDPTCPLTLPSDDLLAPLRPDPALLKKAEPALQAFSKHFTFKAVEKKKRGQTRTWAELLEASDMPSTQVTFEVPGGKRARTDGDGEDEGPTTVSSTRPEEDFAAMLKAGRVDGGFASMQDFIHTTLTEAAEQDMYYIRALSCLKALRGAAVAHQRGLAFNDFLLELKKRHKRGEQADAAFWDQLGDTSLITNEEDAAVSVSKEQASGFWARQEEEQEAEDAMEVVPSAASADLDLDADF